MHDAELEIADTSAALVAAAAPVVPGVEREVVECSRDVVPLSGWADATTASSGERTIAASLSSSSPSSDAQAARGDGPTDGPPLWVSPALGGGVCVANAAADLAER